MYPLFRPVIFRFEPERAHALTLALLRLAGRLPPVCLLLRALYAAPNKPVEAFGLRFKNPLGLAAGYDKDALAWRGLASLGLGHIEIGTVTPQPQAGNPKPRLLRLTRDRALINRMGFPSAGSQVVKSRLTKDRSDHVILGVNIGPNKDTPIDNAADDYLELLDTFAPLADYLAVNVSSPNTIGLRRLQARKHLEQLLESLEERRRSLEVQLKRDLPLLVKLAPDLSDEELDDALGAIIDTRMDGVIATNTTVSRTGVRPDVFPRSPWAVREGGLSGVPLRLMSTRMVKAIHDRTSGSLPIVAVGGIMNAEDAHEKLSAGALLVQVYTGLVYQGPSLVRQIVRGL